MESHQEELLAWLHDREELDCEHGPGISGMSLINVLHLSGTAHHKTTTYIFIQGQK
jgi:hypothetical protein